jgi:hypothetical protein
MVLATAVAAAALPTSSFALNVDPTSSPVPVQKGVFREMNPDLSGGADAEGQGLGSQPIAARKNPFRGSGVPTGGVKPPKTKMQAKVKGAKIKAKSFGKKIKNGAKKLFGR